MMQFNIRKSAQSIAYLAKLSGGGINILKAVKLIYIADRESIARFGFPIQEGENRFSMPHGPVNSMTYSYLQGERMSSEWNEILCDRENHTVSLTNQNCSEDDLDELSDADISCLAEIWQKFKHMDQFEIRDWTHNRKNIPEWEDPNGSSQIIPIQRIFSYVCGDEAEEFVQQYNEDKRSGDVFEQITTK